MRIFRYGLMLGIFAISWIAEAETEVPTEIFQQRIQTEILPWYEQGETGTFSGVAIDQKPIPLHYKAFLKPKAKANIVIIHGFGERIYKYMELAHDFYQEGYNVFLYDQRGFGLSPRLLTRSAAVHVHKFDHYAEDLKLFFDQVVIPKASGQSNFLFAHSMGGAVSTLFLERYPHIVSRAVLSTPMHEMNLRGLPRWLAYSLVLTANTIGRGTSYTFGQGAPEFPEDFKHAATHSYSRWKWFSDFSSSPDQKNLALGGASNHWVMEAFGVTSRFMKEDFPQRIKIPILLFQAGKDSWVVDQGQNFFCQHAPGCELIRYDEAKHEIYREQDPIRSPYLQKILSFFSKLH